VKYILAIIIFLLLSTIFQDLSDGFNVMLAAPFFFTNDEKSDNTGGTLYLKIEFTRRETSKDSNWSRTVLEIKDGTVKKNVRYGGFRAPEDKNISFPITGEQEALITGYISKQRVNRNIKENKPCDGIGISVVVRLTAEIGGKTTLVEISGMSRRWGGKKNGSSNIKNIQLINDIRFLINSADNKFNSLPDY